MSFTRRWAEDRTVHLVDPADPGARWLCDTGEGGRLTPSSAAPDVACRPCSEERVARIAGKAGAAMQAGLLEGVDPTDDHAATVYRVTVPHGTFPRPDAGAGVILAAMAAAGVTARVEWTERQRSGQVTRKLSTP